MTFDHVMPSEKLCELRAKEQNGVSFLSFSMGKDSIGAWIQMRRHFETIIPVYFHPFPGLEFIDNTVAYYEEVFDTRIISIPHPSFIRMLDELVLQVPERAKVIEQLGFFQYSYEDIFYEIEKELNMPDNIYYGTGVRATDSIYRRTAVKKHGPINHNKKSFMAVWDWTKRKLVKELRESKIKLPVDYHWWGKTFDGIDYRFVATLRDRAPRDFKTLIEIFPLVEADLFRWEQMEGPQDVASGNRKTKTA